MVLSCSWLLLLCSLGCLLEVLGRRRCLGADLVHLLARASGDTFLLGVNVCVKSWFHGYFLVSKSVLAWLPALELK